MSGRTLLLGPARGTFPAVGPASRRSGPDRRDAGPTGADLPGTFATRDPVRLWLPLLALLGACVRRADAQAVRAVRVAPVQAWPDEQFEQWVFQQDHNAAGARKRLDSLLALQIEDFDRASRLTDAQKRKLQ